MLIPDGVEHATTFLGAMRAGALHMDASLVAEIAEAMRAGGPSFGLVREPERVAALGALLVDEVQRGDAGAMLAADALVEAMLVAALRSCASPAANDDGATAPDPGVARAMRFVEDAYAQPLAIDDLARTARMSRYHFSRRFRAATGRSPYQYVQEVRVARAAELLRRGRAGVTEVAFAVGFSDPSRFARAFRARFGATPARWAAEARAR
jgi:AraC family transcriptional regulator